MTLQLGIKLSLDKGNLPTGAQEAARAVESIGAAAAKAEAAATAGARATIAAAGSQAAAARAAAKAQKDHADEMRRSAERSKQVAYQLNDVVVSLAGGMNPLIVAMQQGSQIAPMFGGIAGTARAAGRAIAGMMTPINLVIGGIVAIGAAAAYGLWRWTAEQKALDASLQGIGRRAGVTAAALADLAAKGAAAGGISVSSGRDLAATYAGAGLSGGNIQTAIGLTKTLARVTGQDLAEAGTSLASALQDPTKGLETLNAVLGFADEKTRALIRSLAAQGDMVGAHRTLLAALAKDLTGIADNTGRWEEAWNAVKKTVSNKAGEFGQGTAKAIFGPTVDEYLKDLDEKRQEIIDAIEGAARRGVGSKTVPSYAPSLTAELSDLNEQRREIARGLAFRDMGVRERQAQMAMNQNSGLAAQAVYSILPELERRRALDDQIILLEKARDNPAMLEKMGVSAKEVETALGGLRGAYESIMPYMERMRLEGDLALRSIQARSAAERADVAYRQAMLAPAAGTADPAAIAKAEVERQKVLAQATREAQDRLRSAQDDLDLAGLGAYARARAEIEQRFRRQNELDAGSPAALAANAAARRAALATLERSTALEMAADADRLEMLRTELNLVGQSEAVRARGLALAEAEQKIRSQGLGGTAFADQMRAQAIATAEATTALERQRAAWDEIKSTGGSAIDTIAEGLRTGKDVSKQFVDDLTKEAMKLAFSNPLKNLIFGQNLPEIGDVSKFLFGGRGAAGGTGLLPQSIASATITAGTVMVNGSIAGAGVGPVPGGALAPIGANDNGALAATRRAFAGDLADPAVRSHLFAMTEAEVGGQGPAAQQAFMESVMNRASARGMSLGEVLGDRAYFPGSTFSAADRALAGPGLDSKYAEMLKRVQGGSNLSNFATGNASGSTGFAGGPMTFAAGGERFGIEGPDASWARRLQETSTQASQSIGEAGQTLATSTTKLATGTQGAFSTLLGGLGSGIDGLLSGLSSLVSKSGGGLFGGLFSGLFGSTSGAGLATPTLGGLYATGGFTGVGGRHEPAGIVHRGEYVFDAASTAAIGVGNLEAMRHASRRGYASGGYVGPVPAIAAADIKRIATAAVAGDGSAKAAPAPRVEVPITVNNHSSAEVSVTRKSGGRGGYEILLREVDAHLRTNYGMQPVQKRRG